MRVLVCGGRDAVNERYVWSLLAIVCAENLIVPDTIITGGAKGVDTFAKRWAESQGIVTQTFYPDWSFGKKAGPIRNQQMITDGKPDIVIAFEGGRGTADMVRRAEKAGIKVIEITCL